MCGNIEGIINVILAYCKISGACKSVWPATTLTKAQTRYMTNCLTSYRRVGLQLGSLLDHQQDNSTYHTPIFSAVGSGYSKVLPLLLNNGLRLDDPACVEHIEVGRGPVFSGCL